MFLSLVAAFLASSPALAQRVPWVSGSIEVGPENVVGGEFTQLHSGITILGAINARFLVAWRTSFAATAAYALMGSSGDVVSLCIPSPHGGCKPSGPGFEGWTGRLGVERPLASHLSLGGSVGVGWYGNTGRSQPAGAHVVPLRLALVVPMSYVAASVAVEHTTFRDFGGESFYSNAVRVGITVP